MEFLLFYGGIICNLLKLNSNKIIADQAGFKAHFSFYINILSILTGF